VSVRLATLAERVPQSRLHGDPALEVTEVDYDSRKVHPGALFVAIRGLHEDGNRYVPAALERGAVAIASENPPSISAAWVEVPDAREALAQFSAGVLGDPAVELDLVGVTGTNGKTTCAYLVEAALEAAGRKVGLVGTVEHRIAGQPTPSTHTTPESSDLQTLFRMMVDAGCSAVAIEVSSHAVALRRVHGCRFSVAIFTNLSRDHLDFHGDMDAYFGAKRQLFTDLMREDGTALINADDSRAEELQRAIPCRVWTFGLERSADLRARDLRLTLSGSRFQIDTPAGTFEVETPLIGRFNVRNLLAAFGACLALGLSPEPVLSAFRRFPGVPGRMQTIDAGQDFTVIVDYAHTDDALRSLLETVRELSPVRVITVFGCGGERDPSKRPLMGAVAAKLSDWVVITNDNPRSEAPESIIEQIQRGMGSRVVDTTLVIPDRRDAIERALQLAESGDAVVIAGKGHESVQVLRDRSVPFDDRQIVRQLLAQRGKV
jgi:UDP-N-acetylmuramoyl-L-alanyl-D-glutamate--2,6-diaminopimelate ligase